MSHLCGSGNPTNNKNKVNASMRPRRAKRWIGSLSSFTFLSSLFILASHSTATVLRIIRMNLGWNSCACSTWSGQNVFDHERNLCLPSYRVLLGAALPSATKREREDRKKNPRNPEDLFADIYEFLFRFGERNRRKVYSEVCHTLSAELIRSDSASRHR